MIRINSNSKSGKKNLFEYMAETAASGSRNGDHDIGFEPEPGEGFKPTDHMAGTAEKVRVMAERVANGFPIFHPEDCPLVQVTERRVDHFTSDAEKLRKRGYVVRKQQMEASE